MILPGERAPSGERWKREPLSRYPVCEFSLSLRIAGGLRSVPEEAAHVGRELGAAARAQSGHVSAFVGAEVEPLARVIGAGRLFQHA
jgi:hypothetical protein